MCVLLRQNNSGVENELVDFDLKASICYYLAPTSGTSILGEVRNVVTRQLLCRKFHDFLAVFALAHSKTNQIA